MKKVSSIFSVLLITLFLAPHSFGEEQKKKPEENNPNFHKQLLEVAGKYESYGKVNDLAKWAPWLCRMPPPPKASFSKAEKSPHGRKLYFLYAADRNQYFENKPPQVGQVIVKESWIPENNEPSKKFGLFIMMKLDPKTKGADQGWVYGTVSADGKTVSSSGRVESCMGCHVQTKNDRLFGMKIDSD